MLAAFGRLWLHDHRCRSLVSVDLATGRPTTGPLLGPEPAFDESGWDTVPISPQGLLATGSALWLSCRGTPLRRIDPTSARLDEVAAPGTGWFAANRTALFGLSDRPDRVLTRVDDADGSRVRRAWRGYSRIGVATDQHLWLVDRTTERLVRLAADSLEPEWEHDFAGGEVTHLFASGAGVVAVHNRDLADGIRVSKLGICNRSQVYRVGLDGTVSQVGEIGTERVLAYDGADVVWIGRSHRAPSFRRDPAGKLTYLDLRTGALHQHPAKVPGQVDRISATGDVVFASGFRRSGQRDALWRIGRRAEQVRLTDLPLQFDPAPSLPDETLRPATATELEAEIRSQLTAHGRRFDHRRDEWVDAGPTIHRDFTLREVRVDVAAPRVTVRFDWAPEPGTVFGLDFDTAWLAAENTYGPGLSGAAASPGSASAGRADPLTAVPGRVIVLRCRTWRSGCATCATVRAR